MDLLVSTAERVPKNTDPHSNRRIEEKTQIAIREARGGGSAAINRRLIELDREWDIERCLETGAASFTLLGLFLGKTLRRRGYLLSAGVAGFLLQHAIQGWCPPLSILRRLGVRTADEINRERFALKALRGDFSSVNADEPVSAETSFEATKH